MQIHSLTQARSLKPYLGSVRKTLLLSLIAAVFALTGCGQKGPLYLPQPEQPAATPE